MAPLHRQAAVAVVLIAQMMSAVTAAFDVANDCDASSTDYAVLVPKSVTGVTFCAKYVEADEEYEFLMLIDESLQWGAVGFNTAGQMVGTEVMWLGMESSSPTLKYKKNTAYSEPNDSADQPDAPEVESVAGTGIQARWRRPLAQGGLLTLTSDTSNLFIVLASKSGTPGAFGYHNKRETLKDVNLSVPGVPSTPAPPPAPVTEPPQEKTFDVAEDCNVNSTVYAVLTPKTVTGVTFCSRYVVADKEYEYLMLIDKSLQWGAVGFNTAGKMVGTEVMWLGMENASPTLKYKKNTGYSKPDDTTDQPDAPEVEKIAAGIQARWRRPLAQGGLLTLTDDTSNLFIVLASKSGTPGGFDYHDKRESLKEINLSVPGASSGKDVAILTATNAKLAHGALMILAWGCFSPIATMFMKFGKHLESTYWFKGHKYLQFASIVTTIVAAIIIFTSDVEFQLLVGKSKEHAICGLVVLSLCIVQGLLGYFRGKISKHVPADGASKEGYTHGPNRYIFNMLHRTTGWTLFGLALYTIFMGVTLFEEYNTDDVPNAWLQEPAKELFMAYCFVAAGLIVVLELLHVTKYKWSSGGPFSCSGSTQVTDTFKAEDDFEKKVRTIALSLFASFSIAVSITLWVIIAGTEKIKVENHDHGNHTH